MGGIISKHGDMVLRSKAVPSSYFEETFSLDPNLESFSTTLRQNTTRAITSLAEDAAILHSFSCKSLNEAADVIVAITHDALHNILKLKDDISTNPDLLSFIKDHLQNSVVNTLKFFETMKACLGRARETGSTVFPDALRCFKEADYQGTLQKLREFKKAGDPFTADFIAEFRSVWEQHRSMLIDLDRQKPELDKKLGTDQAWRKVWAIVYVVVFVATAICSFLIAGLVAPSAATAAAAAALSTIGSIGQWIDSLWDKGKKQVIKSQGEGEGTYYAIHELASVRAVADKLVVLISRMVETASVGANEEAAAEAKVAMEDMNRKSREFTKSADKLENKMEQCRIGIQKATEDIFNTLTNSA